MNPLFIYGASGVGKSHLLRAVQHSKPETTVSTTALEFCDELVKSILHGESCKIDYKLRYADIVLIDDLQYIAEKVATQDELSRLIISLCNRDQQVILACDRPLEGFPVLYDRLRKRCRPPFREVAIQAQDRQLRKKLIRKRTKAIGLTLSNETAAVILENAYNSRQIDGMLNELRLKRSMKLNGLRKKENSGGSHTS